MYDESIYNEAERYLKTALRKWQNHLPELWDDALQEGMIQVWRDVEKDVQPKIKLLRRAAMSAEKYIHRNGEYSFGKPKKSRDGISPSSASREKVEVFLEEYLPVHNWVYPSAQIVADATGLKRPNVAGHLKNIREGRVDHMVYREDGRKDWDYYKSMSVELLVQESGGSEMGPGNRAWTDNPQLTRFQESWEDDVVSQQSFNDILNKLAPEYREILYLFCVEQYNRGDIGRHVGVFADSVISQGGTKRLNSALNQARLALGVYEGRCRAGHTRSEETSEIRTRDNGQYYYHCKKCKGGNASDQWGLDPKKKSKSKLGDPCGNGHTKDKLRNGYARCSACLNERQKEYLKRKEQNDSST